MDPAFAVSPVPRIPIVGPLGSAFRDLLRTGPGFVLLAVVLAFAPILLAVVVVFVVRRLRWLWEWCRRRGGTLARRVRRSSAGGRRHDDPSDDGGGR